ncbi:MAG: glycosyltransferase family 87 protein [Pararhodobacter sp.]
MHISDVERADRPLDRVVRNGGPALETSPLLAAILLAFCALLIWQVVRAAPHLGDSPTIVDFDAFYITGLMIAEGTLTDAYHLPDMMAAQQRLAGAEVFMTWTYPPPYNLIVQYLPLLPRGLSFALFTGLTLAAYGLVLWRLAGRHLTAVLLVLAPVMWVQAMIGQNGFLTGALAGWFCLACLRGGAVAGLPLGLMVIKPHLGLGLGLAALVQRRWAVLALALGVAGALSALATLAFGAEIWAAFRRGVAEAGLVLHEGGYRLHRMTSIYATLHRLGVAPETAALLQAGLGIVVLAAVPLALWRGARPRVLLAVACFASLMVSPYGYDYDLTLFGIGLALIIGDLLARATVPEKGLMLIIAWIACGWGLYTTATGMQAAAESGTDGMPLVPAIMAPTYLLLMLMIWRVMARPAPADAPLR